MNTNCVLENLVVKYGIRYIPTPIKAKETPKIILIADGDSPNTFFQKGCANGMKNPAPNPKQKELIVNPATTNISLLSGL